MFIHKATPQDVQDKIIAVAQQTMASEAAQKLAADTGAAVYWQPAAEVVDQIAQDIETLARIESLLAE